MKTKTKGLSPLQGVQWRAVRTANGAGEITLADNTQVMVAQCVTFGLAEQLVKAHNDALEPVNTMLRVAFVDGADHALVNKYLTTLDRGQILARAARQKAQASA